MTTDQLIDVESLREMVDTRRSDLQLIDVRSPREFSEGHIPGAVNMPLEQAEARLADLDPSKGAVLICKSGRRAQMCKTMLEHHQQGLRVLEGGTDAWVKSGLPVVRSVANRLALMRQVQIGAGSLVLAGTLMGALVSPTWLVVSGFVGVGLLIAGTTGFCGMAVLLEKMPWNASKGITCEAGS